MEVGALHSSICSAHVSCLGWTAATLFSKARMVRLSFCILPTGLFRKPDAAAKSKKRRRKPVSAAGDDVVLGSLADLRAASKGGMDPSGVQVEGFVQWGELTTAARLRTAPLVVLHGSPLNQGSQTECTCSGQGSTLVAADVMWSDPSAEAGLRLNDARGVGIVFGADVTQVGSKLCTAPFPLFLQAEHKRCASRRSHLCIRCSADAAAAFGSAAISAGERAAAGHSVA
jgi:hypothetical protein